MDREKEWSTIEAGQVAAHGKNASPHPQKTEIHCKNNNGKKERYFHSRPRKLNEIETNTQGEERGRKKRSMAGRPKSRGENQDAKNGKTRAEAKRKGTPRSKTKRVVTPKAGKKR